MIGGIWTSIRGLTSDAFAYETDHHRRNETGRLGTQHIVLTFYTEIRQVSTDRHLNIFGTILLRQNETQDRILHSTQTKQSNKHTRGYAGTTTRSGD